MSTIALPCLVLALSGCSTASSSTAQKPLPAQRAVCRPALKTLSLAGAKKAQVRTAAVIGHVGALSEVTIGGGYLAYSLVEVENGGGAVFEQKLPNGKATPLKTPGVVIPDGLTSGPLGVYVITGVAEKDVLLVPHHNATPSKVVLHNLVAPLSTYGDSFAYVTIGKSNVRTIGVMNMRTGKTRVYAHIPSCANGKCSRVDQVELTKDAVVWDEGAIGPQPSYLLYQPRDGSPPSKLEITGDEQPDLVQAKGPMPFRRLGCDWQMWDGHTTYHAPYQVPNPGQLLEVADGTWYATLGGQGQQVVARGKHNLLLDEGGRVAEGGVALFGGFALNGNLAAVGWNVFGPRHGPTASLTVTGASTTPASSPESRAAVARYRRFVSQQADLLLHRTEVFKNALDAGNLKLAKRLYPWTREPYERIEPVAETFGKIDPLVDGRIDTVPVGQFVGFHRIEQILWQQNTTQGTRPLAAQLLTDVGKLNRLVKSLPLQPAQIANGAKALLDEVATSKITGEEDRYSHTDLWDFEANVEGSQIAVDDLSNMLQRRNPALLRQINSRFADVEKALKPYRRGSGYVYYTQLNADDTRTLSAVIQAVTEPVANVAGVVLQPVQGGGPVQVVHAEITPKGCVPGAMHLHAGPVTFKATSHVANTTFPEFEVSRADTSLLLSEVERLKRGQTQSISLNLKAGPYRIFCGRTPQGQRKNPNLGEQNEHEDPAFAVIRLVTM
jgi:hypothetical protein